MPIDTKTSPLAFKILNISRCISEDATHLLECFYLPVHGEEEQVAYNARYGHVSMFSIRRDLDDLRKLLEQLDKLETEPAQLVNPGYD
jgi:hypothetical protein